MLHEASVGEWLNRLLSTSSPRATAQNGRARVPGKGLCVAQPCVCFVS